MVLHMWPNGSLRKSLDAFKLKTQMTWDSLCSGSDGLQQYQTIVLDQKVSVLLWAAVHKMCLSLFLCLCLSLSLSLSVG